MVTIGMNYDVKPGKEQEFEEAFKKVLKIMDTMEGHQSSQLYKRADQLNCYMIISEWTDKIAYGEFLTSKEFAEVTTWGKNEILMGRPSHRNYASPQ